MAQTTAEQRQALRDRYTPEPEPRCEICESPMVYRDSYGDGSQRWDCTVNSHHPQFSFWRRTGDPNVLAAVADAAALASAQQEIERLRRAILAAMQIRDGVNNGGYQAWEAIHEVFSILDDALDQASIIQSDP